MKRSEELLKKALEHDKMLLTKTGEKLNPDVFVQAVDMISKARHVYILGVRSCAPLAEYLGYYMHQIHADVRVIRTNSASEIFEQLLHLDKRDVVVGISFPRYSMRVLKALEFANSRSAGIITLTDNPHSPVCLYSSCNLLAYTKMTSIVDSMTAPIAVINALVVALCAKNRKAVFENLQEMERIWQEYPVDSSDEMNFLNADTRIQKDISDI
ncbi:MAG: MurR/RpiR family transcriptional regulator [Lachnospiraceae bacterium]|nr:MurR/RpiR family transcriptional regulator [Lachnospiraceae bacterium]